MPELPTHEQVTKAFNRPCHFTCRTCTRRCTAGSSHNHRFDCCGVVVAHVMGPNLTPQIVTNATAAGFLVGTASTRKVS